MAVTAGVTVQGGDVQAQPGEWAESPAPRAQADGGLQCCLISRGKGTARQPTPPQPHASGLEARKAGFPRRSCPARGPESSAWWEAGPSEPLAASQRHVQLSRSGWETGEGILEPRPRAGKAR